MKAAEVQPSLLVYAVFPLQWCLDLSSCHLYGVMQKVHRHGGGMYAATRNLSLWTATGAIQFMCGHVGNVPIQSFFPKS